MFIYVIQSQHDLQVCSVVAVGTPDYISPEILMAMNDGQGFLSCLLIPPPHPASSSRLLIPPPHPASSSRLLIPPPHPASSSRLLIPPPHPTSSSRLLIPPPHPTSSSRLLIPPPHPASEYPQLLISYASTHCIYISLIRRLYPPSYLLSISYSPLVPVHIHTT